MINFNIEYWLNTATRLYYDMIHDGYSKNDALHSVHYMLHLFDNKYGCVVIDDFLKMFEEVVKNEFNEI